MKKRLLFWFVTFVMVFAFKIADAKTYSRLLTKHPKGTERVIKKSTNFSKASLSIRRKTKSNLFGLNNSKLSAGAVLGLDSITKLLRLKLIIDTFNYDDIAIAFNSGASAKYDGNEDAQYLPGINAPEGLASFSSDGVPLSINYLPLPAQGQMIIKLDVEASNNWPLTLKRTQLDSLPKIYEVWLMDSYKKDSLDLRANTSYAFTIDKADTATFGKNRFYVLIRQTAVLPVTLKSFTAIKIATGSQVIWSIENELSNTSFTVERSTDNGFTFIPLKSFYSTGRGIYNCLDKDPALAVNQYRLKIEDVNKMITYSSVVTLLYSNLNSNTDANSISVYPNPAASTINLSINQNKSSSSNLSVFSTPALNQTNSGQSYSIKIINITGSVIKTAVSSQTTWQENVDSLKPGTYIIQVINNSNKSLVGKSTFVKL